MNPRLEKIKEIIKEDRHCPAHDINHVMRVYNLALNIARGEPDIDMEVLEAATLLHDIGGAAESQEIDHATAGADIAKPILRDLGFDNNKIKHIQDCIITHRYKTNNKPQTKEAQILFDADKLDALGAIGIARAFVWVGRHNAHIYKKVEDINKYLEKNFTDKKNGRIKDRSLHSPQIEFEIKMKKIIEKLHTKKAKEIGQERFEYFEKFLDRLEGEINGKL